MLRKFSFITLLSSLLSACGGSSFPNDFIDTTPPTITVPDDITIQVTAAGVTPIMIGQASATDEIDGTIPVTNNAPTIFPIGVTIVTYQATDSAGNTATAIQTVTLIHPDDTEAPIISVPDDLIQEATGFTTPITLGTAHAIDLVDGQITPTHDAPSEFLIGTTIVTYTATDSAGHHVSATQKVTLVDTTPPIITAPADIHFISNNGNPVSGAIGTASAVDLVDGIVTVSNNAPILFPIGSTTITYHSTDAAGNSSSAIQTVTVTIVYTSPPETATTPSFIQKPIKGFQFDWLDVSDASFYRLLENPDGISGFTQLGEDIPQGTQTHTEIVPLHQRANAQYLLQSCNDIGCTDSTSINISSNLVDSIGTLISSNRNTGDRLGWAVRLSADANTLVISAPNEDSSSTGINGDETDNSALQSGAVYIFSRNETTWTQQAYLKANNAEAGDEFGYSLSLSDDGNTLAVGARLEDSNAKGINGNHADNSAIDSGATYIFTRSGNTWTQQAYLKASNADTDDEFGHYVELSSDGNTLAISAIFEDSNAVNINGDQTNNSASNTGATYLFTRTGTVWAQQAYLKASNTGNGSAEHFGQSITLSSDANTLAVSADDEDSGGTNSGAVYTFTRNGEEWSPQSFIKHNTPLRSYEFFGQSISLSGDGTLLAVGSPGNDSAATGINGDPTNTSANASGAAYIFRFDGTNWIQESFIKASNTEASDSFGDFVVLSSDGKTLAISATKEDSNAIGINGNELDNTTADVGAVYVFKRIVDSWEQQAYVKNSTPDNNAFFGVSMDLSSNGETLAIGARGESGAGAVHLY